MTRKPAGPLAAVHIGIDDYILPMADALKIVEIMGRARPVERSHVGRQRFILREDDVLNRVALSLVHERDITEPEPAARPQRPLLLSPPTSTKRPLL